MLMSFLQQNNDKGTEGGKGGKVVEGSRVEK
jgi:hypothetical protein